MNQRNVDLRNGIVSNNAGRKESIEDGASIGHSLQADESEQEATGYLSELATLADYQIELVDDRGAVARPTDRWPRHILQAHEKEKAKEYLRKIIELDPSDKDAQDALKGIEFEQKAKKKP